MNRARLLWTLCLLSVTVARAEERSLSPEQYEALLDSVQNGLVQVEYQLQYDKGEPPTAGGWGERCPNCGQYHALGDVEMLLKQKRPLERTGWLVAPTQVLAPDMQIEPRFVAGITVRKGDATVAARVAGYCRSESGCLLALDAPLPGAEPLKLNAQAEGPYYAITRQRLDAEWQLGVEALSTTLVRTDDGRRFTAAPNGCVIVNALGEAAGISLDGELAADGTWKGGVEAWPTYSADALDERLAQLETATSNGLLPVTLKFRSPKAAGTSRYSYMWDDDDDDAATELHVFGIARTPTELVVLAALDAKLTARLEHILVRLPDGETAEAKFGASARDWGCFTATLADALPAALPTSSAPITAARDRLVVALTAEFFGETPIVHRQHARIADFSIGDEGRVYPSVPQDEESLLLFDSNGVLLALPMSRRDPLGDNKRWSRSEPSLTPVAYVFAALAGADAMDPNNAPRSEEEENRIAWLGVEMQNLDSDLATVNHVSEITQDGSMGAMVSYVYPDSPAAAAGLRMGDILLQLHVPEHHRPVPVRGDDMGGFGFEFPWEQLGEVPEEMFSEIPQPWPSVENEFTETLTGIGFGMPFELEYLRDGKSVRVAMTVTESPAHYDSAKRFKSEELGLTVRDLTYEVRRFFQLAPEDTGVIIAKIEPGSKASVAGLRPYEIILKFDEDPVVDAAGFNAQLSAASGEVRLNVKRMSTTRVVKLKVASKTEAEAPPAEE